MKARERERKEHIQGANSEGKDTRTPIKDLEQKLSLIHISEPTRLSLVSRMPSSA